MHSTTKWLLFLLVLFGFVFVLWQAVQDGPDPDTHSHEALSFSDFSAALDEGRVESVTIHGSEVTGRFKDSTLPRGTDDFMVDITGRPEFVTKLLEHDIPVNAEPDRDREFLAFLLTWGPVLLIVSLWVYFMAFHRR